MSTPTHLYLTYNSSNVDIIQNSIESIRGTRYYFDLFNNVISFNHLIELTEDSSGNNVVAYTLKVNNDIYYRKEKQDWSSAIMTSDTTGINGSKKNVLDTLNNFHTDSSITETIRPIHIKYDNKTYLCDTTIVLFGKRYYILHESTNPTLPPTVTVA